jgi:Zn-dependent protease with chaperone function
VPFLILTVLGAVGGIFYLFFAIGRIPVQLAVALGLGAIYTLIAIVRSVFTRVHESEPGRILTVEEAPQLWAMTERVAQRVGTRPIETVYINPGTSIAVTERGGMWKKLRGAGQRCLIVGLGVLPGMTQSQFEAVLAHEYGHFSNRDTAGGNIAWQVQASLQHMAYRLAMSGQARWYNPAWLFVNGFYRLFLRVTLGASRLQEILADRYAALDYGTHNFIDGLTHVVRQSLVFDYQINQEVRSAVEAHAALHNLYTLPVPDADEPRRQVEKAFQEIINRPTSPYDSHPSYRERLDLVRRITSLESSGTNVAPVWDLLPSAEALQDEMTEAVQANVRQ